MEKRHDDLPGAAAKSTTAKALLVDLGAAASHTTAMTAFWTSAGGRTRVATASSALLWPRLPVTRQRRPWMLLLPALVLAFWIVFQPTPVAMSCRLCSSRGNSRNGICGAAATTADDLAGLAELADAPICMWSPRGAEVGAKATTLMPYIPPKIWQIYLDYSARELATIPAISWMIHSPSYARTIIDATGATAIVARLVQIASLSSNGMLPKHGRDALSLYALMTRRVMRGDFLRYLVLALEGGVYSDMDTTLLRPVRDWVPEAFRNRTRLVVGLEADASPPVEGTTYEVQFCQWTMASAANHPTMWTMVDRILDNVHSHQSKTLHGDADTEVARFAFSDDDVLRVSGPAAWSEVVYEHLNRVAGTGVGNEPITWKTLTGMTEPRLLGDTLVLPIDAFATGVPHSNASLIAVDATLLLHRFEGAWKGSGD